MTLLAAYEKQGRKPRSESVPGTSAYVKSKLQRLERSDLDVEVTRRQKEYSRGAAKRRAERLRGDQESGRGSRETLRLPDLQSGAPVSGAESAGRVDGNQSKGKRKKGGTVSQDSSTLSRKRGVGDDDLLS